MIITTNTKDHFFFIKKNYSNSSLSFSNGDQYDTDIFNYTNLTQTSVVIGNYPDFFEKKCVNF